MNFKGQFQPNLVQIKHPWVKGIQVSTNKGPFYKVSTNIGPFTSQKGDNDLYFF